jgi:hypothetical protein
MNLRLPPATESGSVWPHAPGPPVSHDFCDGNDQHGSRDEEKLRNERARSTTAYEPHDGPPKTVVLTFDLRSRRPSSPTSADR